MITITEQPPHIESLLDEEKAPPVPVSDCWKWCMQPDAGDGVGVAGAQATVVVTFPAVTTIPANGTTFKIWGYDFTVDDSEGYTSSSFEVTASGLATVLNFSLMIQANIFFNRAVTMATTIDGSDFVLTITWNECREQPRFSEENMVFDGIEATGGSAVATNGSSPEYTDSFRVISRVGYYGDGLFKPITKFSGSDVDKKCDSVGSACVEYVNDVETQLYTELPALTSTSFIAPVQGGNSMMRLFSIEYGWVYRESCSAKSGTIKKSDFVLGLNAAFDIDDKFQMRRYWYDHPDGLPPGQFVVDFLTTQPKSLPLSWDSYKWLWLLNNWRGDYGPYDLKATFALYKKNVGFFESFSVIIDDSSVTGSSWLTPINFNVSPQYVLDNAPTLDKSNLDFYEVVVVGVDQTTGDPLFNASEILKFVPKGCCDDRTDIYFLEPPGGVGTMVVQINKKSVVQEGQEINLQVACGLSRDNRARYGGRTMVNLRSYEQIDFSITVPRNLEWRRWLKHFRSSPQHWIKVNNEEASNLEEGGDPFAKKLLLEPGSGTIYENGQGITFTGTGYLADIATQKGTEPVL